MTLQKEDSILGDWKWKFGKIAGEEHLKQIIENYEFGELQIAVINKFSVMNNV